MEKKCMRLKSLEDVFHTKLFFKAYSSEDFVFAVLKYSSGNLSIKKSL